MNSKTFGRQEPSQETATIQRFVQNRDDAAFAAVFRLFTPRLLAFYRSRGCEKALAEDLAQDVMMTVYLRAGQLRDHSYFSAWLFRIAKNILYQHCSKRMRQADTVPFDDSTACAPVVHAEDVAPTLEFRNWMRLLDPREREVVTLRFVEDYEYNEIASAKSIPIGTVQWRVFNAKRKLAPHLCGARDSAKKAA